ncbi:MAG TPA: hypothetical protein VGJ56_18580 [Reyranella sp.]|jgi:hypothetical protein
MNQDQRPRKNPDSTGPSGRRKSSPIREVAPGELKGKPLADTPAGPRKAPVTAARQMAAGAERTTTSRRDLPLPNSADRPDRIKSTSLRLRLLVEGDRIGVLSALEVDAPAAMSEQVRGTDFLEVRVDNQLLALESLIEPGLAVGTPDPRDKRAFRGHRVVELSSYELTVRLPLDALETIVTRNLQGIQANKAPSIPLEIAIYRATEHLVIDPTRFELARAAENRQLVRVASTGPLSLEEVRRSGSRGGKPSSY